MRAPLPLASLVLALPACVIGGSNGKLELRDASVAAARRIAVLPFTGADGYPRVTADWVSFRLAESGRVDVVSSERSELALRDAGFVWPRTDEPTEASIRAAATILRVDALVGGTTSRTGQGAFQMPEFSVELRVWDGTTGRTAGRATAATGFIAASSDYAVLRATAEEAADSVTRAFGLDAKPTQAGE